MSKMAATGSSLQYRELFTDYVRVHTWGACTSMTGWLTGVRTLVDNFFYSMYCTTHERLPLLCVTVASEWHMGAHRVNTGLSVQ